MSDEEHEQNMQVKDIKNPPPFYSEYVKQVQKAIIENAELEVPPSFLSALFLSLSISLFSFSSFSLLFLVYLPYLFPGSSSLDLISPPFSLNTALFHPLPPRPSSSSLSNAQSSLL